jgi:hypothetical protein
MGGIHEVRHWNWLSCHDIDTSFIKIGSAIQKVMEGIHRHTYHGDRINLLLFFQNIEIKLHNLYSSPSIMRMIKSRRMRWAEHVTPMERRGMHIGY